ncbi:hypothetical protein HDU98_004621 [Podochytrium sp. JEL0797]|nr:hypothetical protein HDU98_004621 [Podochytrium sp. JEL0797]
MMELPYTYRPDANGQIGAVELVKTGLNLALDAQRLLVGGYGVNSMTKAKGLMNEGKTFANMLGKSDVDQAGYRPESFGQAHSVQNSSKSAQMTPASLPLVKAGLICFTFFLVQLLAGWFSHSLALISDSVHLLTDVIGYAVAVAAVEIGTWPATKRYTFGFARVELIGALISLFLTWNLVFGLIEEALNRINEPQEINTPVMLVSAIFGVAANTFMAFTLQDPHDLHDDHHHLGSESDSDDEDSSPLETSIEMKQTSPTTSFNPETSTLCGSESFTDLLPVSSSTDTPKKKIKNINIQAAMVHILGDLLGSISIFIAAILLMFKPEWTMVDPLCTIVFSCIIFLSSLGLAKEYVMILMETSPEGVDVEEVKAGLMALRGVVSVDSVRCWSLTHGKDCCIVRIGVSGVEVERRFGGVVNCVDVSGSRGISSESSFVFSDDGVNMYESEDVTALLGGGGAAGIVEAQFGSDAALVKKVVSFEDSPVQNQMLEAVREHLRREFGFDEVCVEIRLV